MQDVGHNMLHLHVAQQLPTTHQSKLMDHRLSPTNEKDAELNKQFSFSIVLKIILPDSLNLRTKAKKSDIKFSQYT